jgi:hypothetical protein
MTSNGAWGARLGRASMLAALTFLSAACVNPNAIGVQDTGSIFGRVIDGRSQQPVANAIVSVNSVLNKKTDGSGAFSIANVPVGTQTLTVYANGYQTATVSGIVVLKGQASDAGLISLQPST